MMRILFLAEAMAPHIGRWQEEFTALGWETMLASCDFDESFAGRELLPRASGGPYKYISVADQVKQLALEFEPHIINAHFLATYGLTAALTHLHPFVLTLWGSDVLVSGSHGWMRRMRSRFVLGRADLVVADANCLLESAGRLGVVKRKLLVNFGVPEEWLKRGATREPQNRGELRIISTRRFEPLYDVVTLLRACSLLRERGFPFHLTLVGAGSLEKELRRAADEMQLTSCVEFGGSIDESTLLKRLQASDIYVSTATSDSTSVSLLEAMSQQLFPIVADIPGNREWLEDDRHFFDAGDYTQLAERIEAAADVDLRRQSGRKCFNIVRKRACREEQMQLADLAFRNLVDEFACR